MLLFNERDDLTVDLRLSFGRARKRGIAAEILVSDRFHGDHVKVLAHAVARYHCAGQLCGLLYIIRSAGCYRAENDLLGRAAAGEGGDLVFHLFLTHEIVVALFDLHGIAQRAGGARNYGYLLHGCGMGLLCGDERVPNLMISYNVLFVVGHDGVFLLIAGDDDLYALLKVRLIGKASAVAYSAQCGLVYNIGKLRSRCAGGHAGDLAKINVLGDLYLSCVDLEYLLPALEVGKLDGNAAVEAAGARERRVERLGAVGRCEDYYAVIALKAVHLGQELVERLLALVIAAELTVTLFADRVNLVDKYDAGRFFLGLTEQVAHLACSHADKHFDEFRARHREKRHVCFTGHRLGQHGFTCSRRAYEQNALGH